MATVDPVAGRHGRRRSFPGALRALAVLLLPPVLLGGGSLAAADDDLEPAPPWVFFATPDEASAALMEELFENSFADLNKVVDARALLVRRMGVWSVPRLARELAEERHQEAALNAALTVAALREQVGPSTHLAPLIRPMLALGRASEEWRRVGAALALGSFRGPEGIGRPRRRADALIPFDPVLDARRELEEEGPALLGEMLRDQSIVVRCAAALALGKIGGSAARAHLVLGSPVRDAAVEPAMAVLLALGLLGVGGDDDGEQRFGEALSDVEWRLRAAAALGSALQIASDAPPAWTNAPAHWLRKIATVEARPGRDAAEAVFARGCLAWKSQSLELWEQVLATAVHPAVADEVAVAAAQALVWCEDAAVRAKALAHLTGSAKSLQEPVLAGFLLRAGWGASAEGIRACRLWLGNPGQHPRGSRDQDVRWHACIGLLRALHEGRLDDPALRAQALDALDAAADRGLDRDARLKARLDALAAERAALRSDPGRRLPADALAAAEAACTCRFRLFARDLKETAIARANDMVYGDVYALASIKPVGGGPGREKDPHGGAKRFLQKYLEKWPYLSRLDMFAERGRRPAPALAFDDPAMVLDREPR